MATMNAVQLTQLAIGNVQIANAVRQDPAVVKAAAQFKTDLARCARSGAELASEVGASWLRHSR